MFHISNIVIIELDPVKNLTTSSNTNWKERDDDRDVRELGENSNMSSNWNQSDASN